MANKSLPVEAKASEVNDKFKAMLREQREVLAKQLTVISEQLEELSREQIKIEAKLEHIDALIGEDIYGERALVDGPRNSPEHSLADKVVNLIKETGRPLHYREIERELRARGEVLPEGKDPATTLLARYYNDSRLYRSKRGTYALRNGRRVRSVGTRRSRSRRGNRQ